jgi:branched-chain amino acid transport system substrate-binding protein
MFNATRQLIRTAAGVAAIGTVLAACSSGGASGGTSSAAGGSTAPHTPILIAGAAPLTSQLLQQPEVKAGIQAAISSINAGGGVNGHPLKLDFCDTQYETNQELSCMRRFISEQASAVIAPEFLADQTGEVYKLAQAASMPVLGTLGLSPAEFTSPMVFPLSSGIPGWTYGSIADLVGGNCRKISLLGVNEGASEFQLQLGIDALKLAGLKPVNVVQTNLQSDPTFTVSAAKAASGGVCGMLIFTDPEDVPKAVEAVKQTGFTGKISSETAIFAPAIIKALGSSANGIELSSQVALIADTKNPGVTEFLADMKKYQPAAVIDEESEAAWAAMELYGKLMASATNFSSKNVLSTLNSLSNPISLSLVGPFKVKGTDPVLSEFPRIFNPTISNGTIENGVIEPDGKGLFNPFQLLRDARG